MPEQEKFKIEWKKQEEGDTPSPEEKKRMVEEVAEELGATDEIEYGNPPRTLSKNYDTFFTVGMFVTAQASLAWQVYTTLQEREDSEIGRESTSIEKIKEQLDDEWESDE